MVPCFEVLCDHKTAFAEKRLILGAYVSEANLLTSPIGETKCLEEEAAYAAPHCIEAHLDQKQITSEI